jgi:hypothetical protein
MALTEQSVIDQITILEDGQIQVRRADKVLKDGVEIASTYHRHVVVPGADVTREDTRVSKIAKATHTPAVIAAYRSAQPADD